MTKIVVGIDSSDGARRALTWALDEAVVRNAQVTTVHAWQLPVWLATPFGAVPLEADQFEARVAEEIDRVIDEAQTAHGDVKIERLVVADSAAAALIDAAKDADLLVVGTRGRGGFAGLMLGSVSQQVAQHSPCPLVIVP